jgi:hypothetical protein
MSCLAEQHPHLPKLEGTWGYQSIGTEEIEACNAAGDDGGVAALNILSTEELEKMGYPGHSITDETKQPKQPRGGWF